MATISKNKERFLEAAIWLMARDGFLNTSFASIAKRCHVSQSAVMHYFPSKELLVEAAIKHVVAQNHAAVSAGQSVTDDAQTCLLKHFVGNLTWAVNKPRSAQVILLLYYFASFNPAFMQLYGQLQTAARQRIEKFLYAGMREKLFASDLPAAEMACRLHDLLLGGLVNLVSVPEKERSSYSQALENSWKRIIKQWLHVS